MMEYRQYANLSLAFNSGKNRNGERNQSDAFVHVAIINSNSYFMLKKPSHRRIRFPAIRNYCIESADSPATLYAACIERGSFEQSTAKDSFRFDFFSEWQFYPYNLVKSFDKKLLLTCYVDHAITLWSKNFMMMRIFLSRAQKHFHDARKVLKCTRKSAYYQWSILLLAALRAYFSVKTRRVIDSHANASQTFKWLGAIFQRRNMRSHYGPFYESVTHKLSDYTHE